MKAWILLAITTIFFSTGAQSQIRLSSQEVMITKLKRAFTVSDTDLTNFNQIINKYIKDQPYVFGESCDPYATIFNHEGGVPSGATTEYFSPQNPETLCKDVNHIGIKSNFSPTSLRLVSVANACINLLEENQIFLQNFQQNICKSDSCIFELPFIQKAYKMFNPIHKLSNEDINNLYNLFKGENNKDSIRKLVLAICLDPVWQTL